MVGVFILLELVFGKYYKNFINYSFIFWINLLEYYIIVLCYIIFILVD